MACGGPGRECPPMKPLLGKINLTRPRSSYGRYETSILKIIDIANTWVDSLACVSRTRLESGSEHWCRARCTQRAKVTVPQVIRILLDLFGNLAHLGQCGRFTVLIDIALQHFQHVEPVPRVLDERGEQDVQPVVNGVVNGDELIPVPDAAAKGAWCQPVEAIDLARRSAKTSVGVR